MHDGPEMCGQPEITEKTAAFQHTNFIHWMSSQHSFWTIWANLKDLQCIPRKFWFCELNPIRMMECLQRIKKGWGLEPASILYVNSWVTLLESSGRFLLSWIYGICGPLGGQGRGDSSLHSAMDRFEMFPRTGQESHQLSWPLAGLWDE